MTADSTAASSAAASASAASSSSSNPPASSPPPPITTKRKVDPVTAVQDSIDGLALSLFEALRGVRDAVVSSSTPVDDATLASSAFHEASSSEDRHPSTMRTTTATSSSTGENSRNDEDDVDVAARAARARLLDGLNVGYFSARAYDALEPDYDAFLLAYLGDDPHARELVEMMGSSSSSSSRADPAGGAKAMGTIGSDPSTAAASVAVVRSSKVPATPGEDPSSSRSSSSSSSSDDVKLPTTRTGSAKVEIGEVGYEFRKEFSSGWFVGRVVEIRPLAANGYDRRCVYSDGDIEDLSMADLVRLAKLDPNDVSDGVPNKKPRLSIKLNAKHREGRPPRATDVTASDDDAAARDSADDCRVAGFPRTPAEHVALLRDAERILDERTTRSLADDVLSRSRAVDDLVAELPGMTRTRLMQMDIIAGLIRDNRDVGREMEEAHAIARIRREEVRKALAENTCLALGVEDEDS